LLFHDALIFIRITSAKIDKKFEKNKILSYLFGTNQENQEQDLPLVTLSSRFILAFTRTHVSCFFEKKVSKYHYYPVFHRYLSDI